MMKRRGGGLSKLLSLVFLLFEFFVCGVFAAFGIQQDESILEVVSEGTEYHFLHYSSVAVFDGQDTTQLSNDILAGMARKAWYEMRDHFNGDDNNPVERMPEVMAALAISDHVYFASSVTGGHGTPFFYTIQGMQQAVVQSIINCLPKDRDPNIQPSHRYDSNCGELLGMYLYFQDPDAPARPTPDQPKAAMVAVGIKKEDADANSDPPVTIWNACSARNDNEVGCRDILKHERSWLRWIRESDIQPNPNPPEPSRTYNLRLKCN